MCGGGSPPPATIYMPDTGAYDRMAQAQISAMQLMQNGMVALKQSELADVQGKQQKVLTNLRDVQVGRANDTAANAARLAALLGPPPPDKSAQAPVLGSDRAAMTKPVGKRGLRIDRSAPASTAAGTGLNIT